jgi:hypothetical protein
LTSRVRYVKNRACFVILKEERGGNSNPEIEIKENQVGAETAATVAEAA